VIMLNLQNTRKR